MHQFELIYSDAEYQDFELIESGKNAALRSIVITLFNGIPSYAIVRRSHNSESEFGEKAEFILGNKAFSALSVLINKEATKCKTY